MPDASPARPIPAKVRTCLWYDGKALEAVRFYVSLLPDSRIDSVFRPRPDGPELAVDFVLGGTPYQGLNGGPQHPFTEAVSISVSTPGPGRDRPALGGASGRWRCCQSLRLARRPLRALLADHP